jgi:hypothetical protein
MQVAHPSLPTTSCTMLYPYTPGYFLISPQLLTRA